jgi:hypothetical protein
VFVASLPHPPPSAPSLSLPVSTSTSMLSGSALDSSPATSYLICTGLYLPTFIHFLTLIHPLYVPSSLLFICEPVSVCTTLLTIHTLLQSSTVMIHHVLDTLARPSCFGTTATAVTNQIVTCSSGPNPVSPEPSLTYNHLPDRCPATCTCHAPARALADHTPHLLIHRALSTQPNVASVPALIQRHPSGLPQPSTGVPLCGTSSSFPHHVGSIAAVPLTMTPV